MAKRACADCGTALKTFTVCDACWQKVYCFCQTCGAPGTAGPGRAAEARVTGGLAGDEPSAIAEAEIERLRQLYDDEVAITRRVLADDMRQIDALRARVRELEARVTGGLAGEPRRVSQGRGAAASDEQPRPASPPTSAVGDLLANVIRKMTLHDWHLRLTQEEANALQRWVLERNGEDKPRRRPRRRG